MKKLEKNFRRHENTVEMFSCLCTCGNNCSCAYCAATWASQEASDFSRDASGMKAGPLITA